MAALYATRATLSYTTGRDTINGVSPPSIERRLSIVETPVQRPTRRRFSVAEKARIVNDADACESGTVGAFLRREGIYSSQLYAWRKERDRGDYDPKEIKARALDRKEAESLKKMNHEQDIEIRRLQRKIARLELLEDIRKKAAGLLNIEYKSPKFDDLDD
ncbi:transposase [Vulcanimicrobium alpinum]